MRVLHGLSAALAHPTAITIGNFDGVHRGHQLLLARVRATANARQLQAVVITFEPHPREFFSPGKAPPRLSLLREKCEMFAQAGMDAVIVLPFNARLAQLGADSFVRDYLAMRLQMQHLVIGQDFAFGAGRSGNTQTLQALAAQLGFSLDAVPDLALQNTRISSTAIRDALALGDMQTAAHHLGRPFSLSGRVVTGQQLGRTLGFPTANVNIHRKQPPVTGIFAVSVTGLGNRPILGAASLGFRPTVEDNGKALLEVHLLDFDRDIYHQRIHVQFHHKLRDEAKYANLEQLTAQIHRDIAETRAWFTAHLDTLALTAL